MNNDAYKLKYLKIKEKYLKLKNIINKNGGMLALQSRQMVQEREKRENLPIELKELIILNRITNCKELLNARKISKSIKNTIDFNIDKIYNYLRDDEPELSYDQMVNLRKRGEEIPEPKLQDLREEFKQIKLQDIDIKEKIKQKRQLVVNQCYRQKFLNSLKQFSSLRLRTLNRRDFNKYMILSKHMHPDDPRIYSSDIVKVPNDKLEEVISLLKRGIYYNFIIEIIEDNLSMEKINIFVKLLDAGFRNNSISRLFAYKMVSEENITNEQADNMIKLFNNGLNIEKTYIGGIYFNSDVINKLIKLINEGNTNIFHEQDMMENANKYFDKIYDDIFSKSEQYNHLEDYKQIFEELNFYYMAY